MSVRVEREGDVAVLTLERPDSLNAWDLPMMDAFADAVAALAEDNDVRAVVLTGAGRGFCAGLDLAALDAAEKDGRGMELLRRITMRHHEATLSILRGPKPYVAAINGAAAGGGLALALACDVRVAVPHAKFVAGYLRVGVAPDGGTTWLLPRLVGFGRARAFLLLNQVLDASHAEEWGLVTEVVPADGLLARAKALAQELASRPRAALAAAKERLADTLGLERQLDLERAATVASAGSPETLEGVAAFLERREAKFR